MTERRLIFGFIAVAGAIWLLTSCGTETASIPNDNSTSSSTGTASTQNSPTTSTDFAAAAQQYRQIANDWAAGLPPEGGPSTEAALVDKFLLLASNENKFRIALEKISFPASVEADATAMLTASKLLAGDDLDTMAALSPSHTQAEFDAAFKKWKTDWDARMAADKVLKQDLGIS
jgi:hypothetical protein